MGRRMLPLLVVLTVAVAGCLGTNIASWGSGSGEFKVKWDGEPDSQIQVTSRMSGSTYEMNLTAQGCINGMETLQMGTAAGISEIRVAGWMVASQQFPQGVSADDASQNIAPASVLIALDSFREAQGKNFESYDKLTVKEWSIPTSVTTMPKLDSKNIKHVGGFGVIALIPASENVLEGFTALDDWQQPVELVGYGVNPRSPSGGVLAGEWEVNDECRVVSVTQSGVTMVVTRINFDSGVVSASGEADDEWSQGDIPIIGTYLYILLIFVAGGGGAVFLFMVSMGLERRGAKLTAREMLTEAQVQMARIVKREVRDARRGGMDLSVGSMIGDDDDSSAGLGETSIDLEKFDVESVLSGVHEGQQVGMELAGGETMMTEDAVDMGDQLQDDLKGGVVNLGESTERKGHTLAFDLDDILNPQAEEKSGYGFLGGGAARGGSSAGPRRDAPRSAEPRDSGKDSGRRPMAGRQAGSADRGRAEEPQPRRRAVRKSREDEGAPERRGPPKRDKPSKPDEEDFSDFSF